MEGVGEPGLARHEEGPGAFEWMPCYPVGIPEVVSGLGKPGYFRGWEEAGNRRGQENHFHKRESAGPQ